jgi:hypothetical protein
MPIHQTLPGRGYMVDSVTWGAGWGHGRRGRLDRDERGPYVQSMGIGVIQVWGWMVGWFSQPFSVGLFARDRRQFACDPSQRMGDLFCCCFAYSIIRRINLPRHKGNAFHSSGDDYALWSGQRRDTLPISRVGHAHSRQQADPTWQAPDLQ